MYSLTSRTVIVRSLESLATHRYRYMVVRWEGVGFFVVQVIGRSIEFRISRENRPVLRRSVQVWTTQRATTTQRTTGDFERRS